MAGLNWEKAKRQKNLRDHGSTAWDAQSWGDKWLAKLERKRNKKAAKIRRRKANRKKADKRLAEPSLSKLMGERI